jgi:hypothetical protein
MLEMMRLPAANKILSCMSFQKQFAERIGALQTSIGLIEAACKELVSSTKLKKVLKVILKVTNQLNAGHEPVRGITIDSLLKLRQLKAQDKKTSVLQYVFKVVQRHDQGCLDFTSDMASLEGAARLSLDSLVGEKAALQGAHTQCRAALRGVTEFLLEANEEGRGGGEVGAMEIGVADMSTFLDQVALDGELTINQ